MKKLYSFCKKSLNTTTPTMVCVLTDHIRAFLRSVRTQNRQFIGVFSHTLYICISIVMLALAGCEVRVDVSLPDAPPALVVDAWINNKNEPQTIRLTKTQPYFDSSVPAGVSGASVIVTREDGTQFIFQETEAGNYVWDPASSTETFGTEQLEYTLSISSEGQNYTAISRLKRVPPVDSITFEFRQEESPFEPEGYYAQFVAMDPVGSGDSYWIKSYKNGVLLNRPFELNIAYDAGFNSGGNIDGVVFIEPIQDAVNPLNDDLDQFVPYEPGDSLNVELHAITNEAFFFLQQVQIQTQRDGGFDEIFAEPLENVASNVVNVSDTPTEKVVGFFNVANVSSRGRKLEE